MLIERLTFKDFLVFPGEQEMAFDFGGSTNLSLILAPNNTGKTTVIRALEFLLYGEESNARLATFPCHARLAKMVEREEDTAWVEATIKSGETRYRVKRGLSFVRVDAESLSAQTVEPFLEVYRQHADTDQYMPPSKALEDTIARLVPRSMFDFYFFKGEELAEKLLKESSNNAIPEHLKKVLYQKEWDDLCGTLKKVERSFSSQITAKTKKAKEYEDAVIACDGLEQGCKKIETDLADSQNLRASLRESYREADDKVTELAGRASPERKAELERTKQLLKGIKQKRDNLLEKKKQIVGSHSPLLLCVGSIDAARSLLDAMEASHTLPPDITEGLLIKMLTEGRCICGREFKPGSGEFAALEELRAQSMNADVTEELWLLHKQADPSHQRGFLAVAREFTKQLQDIREQNARIAEEEASLSQDRDALEGAIDGSAEEELRREKLRREQINQALKKAVGDENTLTMNLQAKKSALSKSLEKVARAKANAGAAGHLALASRISEDFRALAARCQESMILAVHRELTRSVREMYAEIVTDGSTAIIDKSSLMPSIERAGVTGLYAGGGQSQVLLLCYLISLARLRQTINQELRSRFSIATFKEQGFFMDSVFGQTQADYKRGIAKLLPEHMTQLVMLLAGQQWDTDVADGIRGQISNAYGFELTSPREDISEQDYIFDFEGVDINLLNRADPGSQAFTTIRKLK